MSRVNEKKMEGGCGGSSTLKEMNVVTKDDESPDHVLKTCIQEKIVGSRDKIKAFKSTKPEKFRIYRVSAALHQLNEHAYSPRVVSIGPLHKGKEHLLAMEEKKLSYMQCLFNRTPKEDETLKNCVSAMLEMESDARSCYAEEIKLNKNNDKQVTTSESKPAPRGADCDCNTEKFKFAEMMLIDGCFIIELLYRHHEKVDRYDSDDPILRNTLLKSTIQDDLLLLENQIPFSVLKKLYDLTVTCIPVAGKKPLFIEDYVISFFDKRIRITDEKPKSNYIEYASRAANHLLDFSHKIHLGQRSDRKPKENSPVNEASAIADSGDGEAPTIKVGSEEGKAPAIEGSGEGGELGTGNGKKGTKNENPLNLCAMEIHLAGVEFKEKGGGELFDVNFIEWGSGSWYGKLCGKLCVYGILCCPLFPVICILFICCLPFATLIGRLCALAEFQITPFSIYDYTELLLRNLIAYEQCCPDICSYFTSHAIFMDTLIESAKDVELLEKEKVLQNHLGCRDEAANFFNNLCKHIVVDDNNFYIDGLSKVETHCTRTWPRHLKKLRRDYFGSPWSGIAVIATIIIFTLTLLQTIYSILSYQK